VLPGSSLNGTPLLNLRTAGEAGRPTGQLFTPVNVALAGVNSNIIGRNAALNARFPQALSGVPAGSVVTRGNQSVVRPGPWLSHPHGPRYCAQRYPGAASSNQLQYPGSGIPE